MNRFIYIDPCIPAGHIYSINVCIYMCYISCCLMARCNECCVSIMIRDELILPAKFLENRIMKAKSKILEK